MTHEQRINEFISVARRLERVCGSGRILGGYCRDALFGIDASDIDFWIPIRYYPSKARRVRLVMELGEALGQRGFKQVGRQGTIHELLREAEQEEERRRNPPPPTVVPLEVLEWNLQVIRVRFPDAQVGDTVDWEIPQPVMPNELGTYTNGGPTGFVEAYEADPEFFENDRGFNKLQVIFTSETSADGLHNRFHIDLAKCYTMSGMPRATASAFHDWENQTLTISNSSGNTPRKFAAYIRKMQRKLPNFRVNIAIPTASPEWNTLYAGLLQEGVLNAPTRQVVPSQAEVPTGDTLRLDDREVVRRVAERVSRWRSFGQAFEQGVPPEPTPVPDAEGVQPGLRDTHAPVFNWETSPLR